MAFRRLSFDDFCEMYDFVTNKNNGDGFSFSSRYSEYNADNGNPGGCPCDEVVNRGEADGCIFGCDSGVSCDRCWHNAVEWYFDYKEEAFEWEVE